MKRAVRSGKITHKLRDLNFAPTEYRQDTDVIPKPDFHENKGLTRWMRALRKIGPGAALTASAHNRRADALRHCLAFRRHPLDLALRWIDKL